MNHALLYTKKGLTLAELLISIILIGIVMLGVVSFNYAITQIQTSSGIGSLLSLQTAGLMSHITRNAGLAVGTSSNPGIIIDTTKKNSWAAFRQDRNVTPNDYTDDTWVVYNLYRYDKNKNNFVVCEQQAEIPESCCTTENCPGSEILSDKVTNAAFTLTLNKTADALACYVAAALTTRYNPVQEVNPLTNPESSISTRISPLGHSW